MSRNRTVGISGAIVLVAIIGGSIIGSVAANTVGPGAVATPQGQASSPSAPTPAAAAGAYCATYRAAFADALGVDVAELAPAAAKAARAAIDAALADGRLTASQAERVAARIADADGDACSRLVERIGRARPAAGVVRDGVDAVAQTLGMSDAELRAELRTGKDLKAIAADRGVPYATVTAAALAPARARLDAAVAAGTITRARADRILARLEANLADGRLRSERQARPSASPGG